MDLDLFFTDSPRSYFSGKTIRDFDLIFVTVSYEFSYLNLAVWLKEQGIPLRKVERKDRRYPLIVGGGVALTLNPAPLYELFDVILVGEGEPMENELLHALSQDTVGDIRDQLLTLPYSVSTSRKAEIHRAEEGKFAVHSNRVLHKEGNLFGNRFIMELNRGCDDRCYFCAASFIYRKYREANEEILLSAAREAITRGESLALQGTSISDTSYFQKLVKMAVDAGTGLSLSSVKIRSIDSDLISDLTSCGVKNLTLAVESADPNIRSLINKKVQHEHIVNAVDLLSRFRMKGKFYFIAGLPGSDPVEEAEAVVSLMTEIAPAAKGVPITISFAPFSPKAFTPFQGRGMMKHSDYKRFIKKVKSGLRKFRNMKIEFFSYNESVAQAYFGRGDEKVLDLLEHYVLTGNLKQSQRDLGINMEEVMTSTLNKDDFPWRRFIKI